MPNNPVPESIGVAGAGVTPSCLTRLILNLTLVVPLLGSAIPVPTLLTMK